MSGLPASSPWLLRGFARYTQGYLRKHFNALRLMRGSAPAIGTGSPVIVYCNHSSWWDPLICLMLERRFFSAWQSYAPMEALALERYQFFKRLGFFGVEQGTRAGAKQFLKTAQAILVRPGTALWLTPQGRFADARERPLGLEQGLAHLARQVPQLSFIPLAIEYVFWEERLPEVLMRFGPVLQDGEQRPVAAWNLRLEQALEGTMNELAQAALRRDPAEFQTLLSGRAGVGGVYDLWRRGKALLRGQDFNPAHGDK